MRHRFRYTLMTVTAAMITAVLSTEPTAESYASTGSMIKTENTSSENISSDEPTVIPLASISSDETSQNLKAITAENATNTVTEGTSLYDRNSYILWIGDSRAKGMAEYVTNNNTRFLVKKAVNYKWFVTDGIPEIEGTLTKYPDAKIVINLGINDCIQQTHGATYAVDKKYAIRFNRLIAKYPNTKFYYVSVTPIDGDYITHSTKRFTEEEALTKNINLLNKTIKENSSVIYVDANDFMTRRGFETIDHLHYTEESYTKLYNYIMFKIR